MDGNGLDKIMILSIGVASFWTAFDRRRVAALAVW